jgi:hypothetical protein
VLGIGIAMWHSTPIHWVVHVCLAWLVLLCTLAVAERLPVDAVSGSIGSISEIEKSTSRLQKRDNGTFLLRIMPLGASITLGYGSTDHNGYRKSLRQQLRYAGWQVNMIGSLRNGTMHDNVSDVEYRDERGCQVEILTVSNIATRWPFRVQNRPVGR